MPALRQSDDPEQQSPFGALLDDQPSSQLPDELLPEERLEPKTVVVGGIPPQTREIPGLGDVRKGDRKPAPRPEHVMGEGGLSSPMQAQPEEEAERAARGPDRDAGMEELRRQLVNQQQATAALAQRAQAEHQARINAERGMAVSQVSMIDSAIAAAERDSQAAHDYFQAALERADSKGAADAQVFLADARANILRLQEMREGLASGPQAPQPRPQPPPQPPPQYLTPEQMVQRNVSVLSSHLDRTGFPKSAQWIRNNPDRVRDQDAINRVDGVHQYLVNTLKYVPETPDYFDKMEELLDDGMQGAPRRGVTQQRAPRPMGQMGGRGSAAAAPARATAPDLRTGRQRGTPVALSSRQREHARDVLGMSDEEYAAELLDAADKGKLLGMRV